MNLETSKCGLTEKTSSSLSVPQHADSPTSQSSQASLSSGPSETELKNALGFMHKFLHNQDVSEKDKFLDSVDVVATTLDSDRKERFVEHHCNPTLLRDTLKYLLPETASPCAQQRELALSRITRVICCITRHCVAKGMKDFKIGEVAGYLTLCCSDSNECVCHWAADGLHRLYTFIMRQKSVSKSEDNQAYREILQEWEDEKIFWLAWFSDDSFTTMIFKKYLRPDDQMDFILTAIKGLRDDSTYSTKAALHMLKAMLRDPKPNFTKVPRVVRSLHGNLEFISHAQARQELLRFVCLLAISHSQDVAKTLLSCSLDCDCSAAAMWQALTAFAEPAQKVLEVIQSTLLERPLQVTSPGMKPFINSLAATAALNEILKHPSPACKAILRSMYATLSISMACHISYTVFLSTQEIDAYWRICIQHEIPTPPVPSRTLLRNQRSEEVIPHLMTILDTKEDRLHYTVMTFLTVLLERGKLKDEALEEVTQQLCKQLKAHQVEMRSLALSGMLQLTAYPEKMTSLKRALPDILSRLKEANREVNVKALKLLPHVLRSLKNEELNVFTVEVAARVIPMFDDASNKVRFAAISTFGGLFDLHQKGGKDQFRQYVLQSLVPLMVHLHDESTPVTQVCWTALRKADRFLKSFIQIALHDNDVQSFCTNLVKRYREQAESILVEQAFSYLDNPRHTLREGAVKILEIIAQDTSRKETVTAIATVLNLVSMEAKASDIYLAASEVMEVVVHDSEENIFERFVNTIRTIWRG
ncbi:maestro heat-like repeat-containing protein family member 7 isoform X2 [Anolis carolinensis]|uniref:maestro heat-like repeat-containing protein family member 7 isoform X2 n=1 Tax=Anolis carolinensis TaxID=28377 RepID=UPI002F2B5E88